MGKFEPQEVTVAEASDVWNKHKTTVYRALDDYRAKYRHSGKTLLIRVEFLRKKWGDPVKAFHN